MTRAITTWRCAAFALPELAATLAIVGVAVAMLLVGAGRARLAHNSAASQNQLRWIAGVTASYAADHQDRMFGFSWTKATTPGAETELEAATMQAQDIIRRRGHPDFVASRVWFCTQWYSHLPLADYLALRPPMLDFVSPEDAVLLPWARDPEGFYKGKYLPLQPSPDTYNKRWMFSSSYQTTPQYSWDPISGRNALRPPYSQGTYRLGESAHVTQRRLADFAFPSQRSICMQASSGPRAVCSSATPGHRSRC